MKLDPPPPASCETSEHYVWGGVCDGWRLQNTPDLSVIQERMPPGSQEVAHCHEQARQFFFVLSGQLTLQLPEGDVVLGPQQGLQIPPLKPHKAINASPQDVHFLVVSAPSTLHDRVVTEQIG